MLDEILNELRLRMISPISVLREAIKAVPAIRYALGVGGLVATIALIQAFKVDPLVALIGAVVVLVLMGVLVVFARMSGLARARLILPAMVFTWFTLLLFMAAAALLFMSAFFRWPIDLKLLDPLTETVIDGTQTEIVYSFDGETKEHAIGAMYENGVQVAKDFEKAAYWYKKGTEGGDAESMVDYAELLDRGDGVSKNYDKATELFLKSAKLGNVRGLYKIGLYYRDVGDYEKAVKYLHEAALKGRSDAYAEIGFILEQGVLGKQRIDEAIDFYEKGVIEGSLQSKHFLAVALFEGIAGKSDQGRAAQLLEEVAESDVYAQAATVLWVLGNFYGSKDSQVFDPVRAKKVYELAAEKGHPCSRTKVASFLLDESPRNPERAIDILQSGIHDQQPQSVLFLAERLLRGEGVNRDPQRAESLLKLGAKLRDNDSMLMLADAYRSGAFGKVDVVEATKYFAMAAENGSKDAEERLKLLTSGGYQCSASS